jgi:hypothetical protein
LLLVCIQLLLVSTQHLPIILGGHRIYASPFLHFFAGAFPSLVAGFIGPVAAGIRMHKDIDFIGQNGCGRSRQVNWVSAGCGLGRWMSEGNRICRCCGFGRISALSGHGSARRQNRPGNQAEIPQATALMHAIDIT